VKNIGALVPELLFAQRMFCVKTDSGEYSTCMHLKEMVTLFGAVPRALLEKGDPKMVAETFDMDSNMRVPQLKKAAELEVRFAYVLELERESSLLLSSPY